MTKVQASMTGRNAVPLPKSPVPGFGLRCDVQNDACWLEIGFPGYRHPDALFVRVSILMVNQQLLKEKWDHKVAIKWPSATLQAAVPAWLTKG